MRHEKNPRSARRPAQESETGVFKAIPSSVTHAALQATEEGFDLEEEERRFSSGGSPGGGRAVFIGLVFALVAAVAGVVAYAIQANSLSKQVRNMERAAKAVQMQAPGSTQNYKVELVRAKPAAPTLNIGWSAPPQWMNLYIDVNEAKYAQFIVTVEKVDGGLVMQMRRIARDSNRELRLTLNSSAFGPGDYLLRVEGYNSRGQTEVVGWVRIGLQ